MLYVLCAQPVPHDHMTGIFEMMAMYCKGATLCVAVRVRCDGWDREYKGEDHSVGC
jgi:hypothetical protein